MYDYFTQLHDYLKNSSKKFPKKTALICNKKKFTYQQIDGLSDQVGSYLLQSGINRGDRVLVCLGNAFETVIMFWGVLKVGGIVSIINHETETNKIKYILSDSEPFVFVCKKNRCEELQDFLLKNEKIKKIIISDEEISHPKCAFIEHVLTKKHNLEKVNVMDIDLASIIYTSGSTGEPKGVMLTHRNMLAASSSINQYLGHQSEDVIVSALPLSFDYGLYQMIMAFSVGATLILEKNFLFPARILKIINHYNVTFLPVVPTMVSLIQDHNEKFDYDLSSIRCVTNTGAALNIKHIEILKKIFPNAKIFSMYGLTECKRCSYLPPEMIDKKPTSIGIPIPNTQMWVVDEKGRRLGPNQVGELVVRGATVMKGYWNKPHDTEKKLKNGSVAGERVLFTGDYGWFDEDHYLYFQSRIDEVLKCRGIKVSPKEIEDILVSIDGVTEVGVIGVDHLKFGTAICVFISGNETLSRDVIYQYCKKHLSSEKRPNFIILIKNMPKTINGKIDKLSLKAIAENEISSKEVAMEL